MALPHAALSVDLEFMSHLPACRAARGNAPPDVGLEAVDRLRDVFARHDATCTFFTVGDVAERHPDLIRALADDGHEIASHGHTHRHLSELERTERREEMERSRRTLSNAIDGPVKGFRAPSFDIASDHFEMLREAGYEYDASIVPARSIPGWYGGEHSRLGPGPASAVDAAAPEDLAVVPTGVLPALRLPLGGTWFRLFGSRYVALGMRMLADRDVAPVVYVHPWEFAHLPHVEGVPWRVYVRTGEWMNRALERLLAQPFEFVPVGQIAGMIDQRGRDTEHSR